MSGAARSGWILSPFWDVLLFIGAPLAVIAAFVPLRVWAGSGQLSLWLLAFFTFGHHLPGFLRAYGDRELFARYRWRFLLAPPLVFAATIWTDRSNLHSLLLLVFAWDIWHVLMQQYGFLRIYDAKSGVTDARTARLDWAVVFTWYVTLIVLSPHYRHDLLFRVFSTGIPFVPAGALNALEWTLLGLSVAVSAVYIFHQSRKAVNWKKLAALGTFLFATWYLYVALDDFVAGFAIWSAFHCLQYFGIVWVYNRNRRERAGALAAPVGRLFSPRAAWVACYAALIACYGAINYAGRLLDDAAAGRWLMCFVISSGALHYYYDAFIWKIREPEAARTLRLSGGRQLLGSPGLAQAAIFGAALIGLSALESLRPNGGGGIRQALAELSPNAAVSHLNLGTLLREQGQLGPAQEAYARAAEMDTGSAQARFQLALTLAELGRNREAAEAFEQAMALDPSLAPARVNAATMFRRMGIEALQHRDRRGAQDLFARAVRLNPGDAEARLNLGSLLLMADRLEEAERELRTAVGAAPGNAMARNNLGLVLLKRGRPAEARQHLEFALAHGDEVVRASAKKAMEPR